MAIPSPSDPLPDLQSELQSWRRRTMDIVLWVIVSARSLQVGLYLREMHLAGNTIGPQELLTMAPFLAVLSLAIFRRLPLGLRGWSILAMGYLHITLTFFQTSRIDGPAPLALISQPIFAMILMGRTSAWTAAAISVAIYGTFSSLLHLGLMPPAALTLASRGPLQSWAVWSVIFVPVFTLQDRFIALFERLLAKERRMRVRLQEESTERTFLEGALITASERERQAVGHELHDGVCQQITGAMLHCKALEKASQGGVPTEPRHFKAISAMLDDSLGQVHDLARGLSPGTLTAEALLPTLQDLARRTRETFEVDCEVLAERLPTSLDPMVATHLYRIAQEALVNAIKHGQPRRIQISLDGKWEGLTLKVCNDGRSLSDSGRQGMGLRIMRHRSELLGGTLLLTSDGQSGVCITCTIPLSPSEVTA